MNFSIPLVKFFSFAFLLLLHSLFFFEKVLQLSCFRKWKRRTSFLYLFFHISNHTDSHFILIHIYPIQNTRQYFSAIPRLNAQFTVTIYYSLPFFAPLFIIFFLCLCLVISIFLIVTSLYLFI